MKDIEKIIKDFISKVRNRWIVSKLIQNIIYGLFIAISIGTLVSIAGLIVPITFQYWKVGMILVLGPVVALIYTMFSKPSKMETARLIDSSGLKERTTTALELIDTNDDNPFKEVLLNDVSSRLENIDVKKIVSLKPTQRSSFAVAGMIVLLLISSVLPSHSKDQAKIEENLIDTKKQVEKEIEKVENDIEKDKYLSEVDKEKLDKLLAKSKEDIIKSPNSEDMLKQTDATKKLMELKKNQLKQNQFNELTKKLMKNNKLEDMAKNFDKKDFEAANKDIEKLMDQLSKMSDEEIQSLLDSLPSPLDGLDKNQLQQALSQLSDSMKMAQQNNSNSNQCSLDHDHSGGT